MSLHSMEVKESYQDGVGFFGQLEHAHILLRDEIVIVHKLNALKYDTHQTPIKIQHTDSSTKQILIKTFYLRISGRSRGLG